MRVGDDWLFGGGGGAFLHTNLKGAKWQDAKERGANEERTRKKGKDGRFSNFWIERYFLELLHHLLFLFCFAQVAEHWYKVQRDENRE